MDFIKKLESVKRSLAKAEMPERWPEESFQYAQGLARIIVGRLERIVGGKIEVKGIEPKIGKVMPKLTRFSYINNLEIAILKIPKESQDLNAESLKKTISLSKSIVRRLQCLVNDQ